jgi:hypothetical protein
MTGRYQYRLAIGLEEPLASPVTHRAGLPPEHPNASLLGQICLPVRPI